MAESKKTTKSASAKPAAKKTAAKAKSEAKLSAKVAPAKRAVARPTTRTAPPRRETARPTAAAPAAPRPVREPRPLPTAPAGHAPVIAADGTAGGTLALPAVLVSDKRRNGVVFQGFIAALANARQGNAATRNRTRVRGGGAKPWKQKGTGRARQGSIRAPHWRHGAVVFGPNGRSYAQRLPEKMRKLGFAEAFATRAAEGRVFVIDGLPTSNERLRTRDAVAWLDKIGDMGTTLVVAATRDESFGRAVANVRDVALRTPETLQLTDLLRFDTLLVARPALDALAARATVRVAHEQRGATSEIEQVSA